MIKKTIDTVLNVRPIFVGIQHLYFYEGPCRFGEGDELMPEYDAMMNQEMNAAYVNEVVQHETEGVHIMDPIYVERDDWFRSPEAMYEKMAEDIDKVDFYLFHFGIGRGDIYLDFAERYKKPVGAAPGLCCDGIGNTAAVKNRGLEAYAFMSWDEFDTWMRVLRVRKCLKNTRVLLAVRWDSNRSYSSYDNFINQSDVTNKWGIQFRHVNVHELLDQTHPVDPTTNPSTPGRKALNINDEDMKEIEKITDELIANAEACTMEPDMVKKTIQAYYTVQKLLDAYDCNAFTAPCPDLCSTRRFSEEKFTLCMTHSLNDENGISSACEYDINSVIGKVIMTNLSGKAPYMGNTNAIVFDKEGHMIPFHKFNDNTIEDIADKTNLYMTFHSTPNRNLKGLKAEKERYRLAPFAYSGFGATIRYDFAQDIGQVITMIRISPDATKIFIAKGTIAGGAGYEMKNCDQGVFFNVADKVDFYHKQQYFGNHTVLAYGDYVEELKMLAEALGIEAVIA